MKLQRALWKAKYRKKLEKSSLVAVLPFIYVNLIHPSQDRHGLSSRFAEISFHLLIKITARALHAS